MRDAILKLKTSCVLQESWTTSVRTLPTRLKAEVIHSFIHKDRPNYLCIVDGILVRLALYPGAGSVEVHILAETEENARRMLQDIKKVIPYADPEEKQMVWVNFWFMRKGDATTNARQLHVPKWAEIKSNYSGSVGDTLSEMMLWKHPPTGGKLILWSSIAGTGKTFAIRALAWELRAWLRVHYVSDPDALFADGNYIMSVLAEGSEDYESEEVTTPTDHWRLIVLEDTGELLHRDAKERTGQEIG